MNKLTVIAAVLLGLAASLTAPSRATAQQTNVAIIDLGYIFKNHLRFKQMKEDLRRRVETAEKQIRSRQEALKAQSEKLRQFKVQSQEYKRAEADLTSKSAQIQADVQIMKKDFHYWK